MMRGKSAQQPAQNPDDTTSGGDAAGETTPQAAAPPVAATSGRRRRAKTPPAGHAAPVADAGPAAHSVAPEQAAPAATAEAPPEATTEAPRILIHIEPVVAGRFMHGRFDVQIYGRVASSSPVEEVELEAGGVVAARMVFGEPQLAQRVTMPDGNPGWQRAFQLILARPGAIAGTPCPALLRARTSDGSIHAEALDLVIDPTSPRPVTVRTGPVLSGISQAAGRPQTLLYVERVTIDDGGNLAVQGWALAMAPIADVTVFTGQPEHPQVAEIGLPRDDVANVYPAYANARQSGFICNGSIAQPVSSVDSVRVQATSVHGFVMDVVIPVERVPVRPRVAPPAQPVPPPARPASPPQPQPAAPQSFAPFRRDTTYQVRSNFRIVSDPIIRSPADASPSQPTRAAVPMFSTPHVAPARPAAPAQAQPSRTDRRRDIHYYCDAVFFAPDGMLGVDGWAVSAVGIASVSIYLGREKLGEAVLGVPRSDVSEEFPRIAMAQLSGFRFRQIVPDAPDGEHSVRIVVRNASDDIRDEIKVVTLDRSSAPPPEAGEAPQPPPAQTHGPSEFRFELDEPLVINDAVQEPVTGRLTIEGWVLARSGITGVEIFLDDQRLGDAHYGLARQDVGTAFPDWENSLRSGYAFHCPPRSLRDGTHTVRLVARARSGQEFVRSFAISVRKADDEDNLTVVRRRMSKAEANVLASVLDDLEFHPAFRLLLRQTGVPEPERLRVTIESLVRQAYADWQLAVLTDVDDEVAALRDMIAGFAGEHAERIMVVGPADPAFDAVLAGDAAQGAALFGLLIPGDELAVDALAEIALAGGLHRAADFLYADEACVSQASHEREPFFKPDFSPDLLLSTNYIGRPWFASAALLRRVAVTPRALLRDGEYDLVLRCTEQAASVHHVPRLLAVRGAGTLDDAAASKAALAAAAARRGIDAELMDGCLPGTWRLRRTAAATGKVAIIIPTCAARGYIETCINTLRARTAYRNYEIVCIDNIPESQMAWKIWVQQNADRIVELSDTFNWSRFNNLAVAATDSEYLLFLNDDIEITQDDWLDVLLEHAQRPEVGVVGPQLLYPSGKVQHAGMFLGAGIGRHAFRFAPADDPGYFGLALTQRNVIAITGACMLVRRAVFEELGGFDEAHSVINNDLDFCLRAHLAGKLTVYTPHASLTHHELASRERMPDVFDLAHFNSRWKTLFAAGDPYFNPLLSRYSDDYRPDDEAVQFVFGAHPLFDAAEIRRILVVKLDHIGDFVTCLPAIRRLKAVFPHASIAVLAGRHARGFASMEPAIDELIEFDFFFARSQLGEKELTKEDFLELQARLAPYRFDLAVDLRKHLSTRDVLRYTGARFLAGYDYMGQFPFLDIALEWDGDKSLQRKRSHIVDELLALVEAIATACGTDRNLLPTPLEHLDPATLPEAVRGLFHRPVIAMHAGAGNITKTWPAEYFSALIDMLTERNAVNVLLIGGPDEREAADALQKTLLWPDAVGSVVGDVPLDELPRLLSACCLYIGNDSGPKHIAAAMGIPTIGIHSGVVDAIEWAPVGRRAVAVRRNMTCSPCYFARAEDCPRGLACLRYLDPAMVYQAATMMLARPMAWEASAVLIDAGPAEVAAGGGAGAIAGAAPEVVAGAATEATAVPPPEMVAGGATEATAARAAEAIAGGTTEAIAGPSAEAVVGAAQDAVARAAPGLPGTTTVARQATAQVPAVTSPDGVPGTPADAASATRPDTRSTTAPKSGTRGRHQRVRA